MPRWRALLLVLIAALFAAGTMARAMPAAAPPCHEDAGGHQQKERPGMLAVGCCVGCMPAPAAAEAAPLVPGAASALPVPAAARPLDGLTPAPEPHPPRRST